MSSFPKLVRKSQSNCKTLKRVAAAEETLPNFLVQSSIGRHLVLKFDEEAERKLWDLTNDPLLCCCCCCICCLKLLKKPNIDRLQARSLIPLIERDRVKKREWERDVGRGVPWSSWALPLTRLLIAFYIWIYLSCFFQSQSTGHKNKRCLYCRPSFVIRCVCVFFFLYIFNF